jgi:hypothetical protein
LRGGFFRQKDGFWRYKKLSKENFMKRNSLLLVAVLFAISTFTCGCASIMCGETKTINVASNPSQAQYTIEDSSGHIVTEGVTPTNITLKRGAGWFKAGDYKITLEKAGYKKAVEPIGQGLETGWYLAGNIVFGGVFGWLIVDPMTGAMYTIEDVNATLEPEKSSSMLPGNHQPGVWSIPDASRERIARVN